MSPYRTVTRWIIPPEATEIARQYRAAASAVRDIARRYEGVEHSLDATWSGNAKNDFIARFGHLPRNVYDFANSLDQMASEIAGIRVSIQEQEWYPDPPRPPAR